MCWKVLRENDPDALVHRLQLNYLSIHFSLATELRIELRTELRTELRIELRIDRNFAKYCKHIQI